MRGPRTVDVSAASPIRGRPQAVGQRRDERVVDGLAHQQPGCRHALLAGVEQDAVGEDRECGLEVDVVVDDDGSVAAQLEHQPFGCGTRSLGDPLSGGRRAGEGDEVDVGVTNESVPDHTALAVHDIEDTRGQQLLRELREPGGGQRGQLGRLDDHGVAGDQCGGQLPDRLPEREIPRCDAEDDAQGFAPDEAGVAGGEFPGGLRGQCPARSGEVPERRDDPGKLVTLRRRRRLAGIERLEVGEFVQVRLEEVGEVVQNLRALAGRLRGPGGESGAGRVDGAVAVLDGRFLEFGDDLAGGRVADLSHLLGGSCHGLAVDDVGDGTKRGRHESPFECGSVVGEVGCQRCPAWVSMDFPRLLLGISM